MSCAIRPSVAAGVLLAATAAVAGGNDEFTTEFRLAECTFSNTGRNPHFSLNVGDRLEFEAEEDGESVELRITVLAATKWIRFRTAEGKWISVRTRVVEERERADGALLEVSRNYFARCTETDDIYYFGEDVNIYEPGGISHAGAWRAGVNGARPGLIMPGTFLLGARYYQELAPGVALDRAEHVEMGLEQDLPAGEFDHCVRVAETTPLEPGHESIKVYCPGIGLVADNELELVDYDLAGEDDDADDD